MANLSVYSAAHFEKMDDETLVKTMNDYCRRQIENVANSGTRPLLTGLKAIFEGATSGSGTMLRVAAKRFGITVGKENPHIHCAAIAQAAEQKGLTETRYIRMLYDINTQLDNKVGKRHKEESFFQNSTRRIHAAKEIAQELLGVEHS